MHDIHKEAEEEQVPRVLEAILRKTRTERMNNIKIYEQFLNENAEQNCVLKIAFGNDQIKFIDLALKSLGKKHVLSVDKEEMKDPDGLAVLYTINFANPYAVYLFGHAQATSADERKRELNVTGYPE